MNKNELVEAVAGTVGDRQTALAAVDAVLATVVRTVHSGERVALSGFGVFEKVDRPARTARNPATGAPVDLPATSVPRFRAGQAFKDVVSGARGAPDEPVAAPPRARAPRAARAAAPVAPVPAVAAAPAAVQAAPAEAVAAPAKAAKAAKESKAADVKKAKDSKAKDSKNKKDPKGKGKSGKK